MRENDQVCDVKGTKIRKGKKADERKVAQERIKSKTNTTVAVVVRGQNVLKEPKKSHE